MKNVKSILIGTSSFVLAGLVLTLLAPKAAHAIAATLVQVTNTAASPVVTLATDNPGRDTFQAVFQTPCTGGLGSISCNGINVPSTDGAGQAVSMLVIDYVSGSCPGGSGPGLIYLTNYSDAQLDSIIGFGGFTTTTSTNGYFFQNVFTPNQEIGFSTPVRLYAAPGSRLAGIAYSSCNLSISGHFITGNQPS